MRQPDRSSWRPQEGPQYALVICPLKEIFFGGTRGGGRADARSASNQHPASFKRQDCTLVAWYRSLYAPRAGEQGRRHLKAECVGGLSGAAPSQYVVAVSSRNLVRFGILDHGRLGQRADDAVDVAMVTV